ncbi:MAG TPA: iron ABC transporter permease [Nostocaceae cyanobacterium]|nr:iron ABC transporter permease [Nostocaceae cyanobacterium]
MIIKSSTKPLLGLGICGLILLGCLLISVVYGAVDVSWSNIYQSFIDFDNSREHLIIQTVRLPRSLLAILVGAAVAVSGALMQGITRNPLADPSILGINAGAAFAVVVAIFQFGTSTPDTYIWYGFAGAGITAVSVYALAALGAGGLTPLNLTISGVAVSSLLTSLTTAILIVSDRTLEEIRFWLAGSLAGRNFEAINQILPYICIGLILALIIAQKVTILSLGEDIAQGLGQQTFWVKITAAISILLLTGSAVTIAGGIGFIGLIIPHIVRFIAGVHYQWIIPYSAISGAIILLIADTVSRTIFQPQEIPVGVMTAFIGAPFFIYLAKTRIKK